MCIPHIKRDCRLNDFQSLDFQSLKQQPFFIFLFRDFVTQSFRRSPIVSKLPMALLRSLYHNLLFICPYTHEHALSRSFVLLSMTVRSLMAQEKNMSASQPHSFLLRSLHHLVMPRLSSTALCLASITLLSSSVIWS